MENLKQKEVNNSDHRKLNQELEIFLSDDEVGKGLPILLRRGTIIKNIIQQFIRQKEHEMGAQEVVSPVLARPSVYQRSGHLDHYSEYIFPAIEKQGEVFQLRPMTCPHHCIVYRAGIHSYRELPVWICEHSILHRFESSGSLKGLERAR